MGKGSSPPPPAPDYAGAAQATAAGNLEAARANAAANRVNQYTPYGSIEYSRTPPSQIERMPGPPPASGKGGGELPPDWVDQFMSGGSKSTPIPNGGDYQDGGWNLTTRLSPTQQRQFDQNNQINEQLGGVAQQGLGYVQSALSSPLQGANALSTSAGDPQLLQQNVQNALYNNAKQYLDPQFAQSDTALESKLANQGITRGSEAFNSAMLNQSNARQQAYESARNSATAQGVGAAQGMFGQNLQNSQLQNATSAQDFAARQALQQNPINMLNAVRSGQQMNTATLPTQQNVAMQQGTAGPDMLGAATATGQYNQGIYNAQQAGTAGMVGGLGQMGMAAAMMPAGTFPSDRRLKTNIQLIGKHDNGMNIYSWDYVWGEHSRGVMADEVEEIMPEAVVMHPTGFKMVNYSMLGL